MSFVCLLSLFAFRFVFVFVSYFLRPCHARSAGCRAPTKVPVLTKLLSYVLLTYKKFTCIFYIIFNGSACCSYIACVVVVVVLVVVVVERAPLYDSSSLGHLIMVQQGSMCQHRGVHDGRMGNDLGRGLVDDGIEAIVVIGGVVDGAHRAIGLDQRVLAWKEEVVEG